jgi:hypothetical protein
MFGYRVLGFGGHTVAAAGDNITWATTVSGTNIASKTAVYSMGYDPDDPILGSSHGSIADATVDGMVGSASGGAVSVIKVVWINWNTTTYRLWVKFEEGGSSSTEQTGWTSITINGNTFLRSAASFNPSASSVTYNSAWNSNYSFTWATSSSGNPFGTTSNTTVDISMSNA